MATTRSSGYPLENLAGQTVSKTENPYYAHDISGLVWRHNFCTRMHASGIRHCHLNQINQIYDLHFAEIVFGLSAGQATNSNPWRVSLDHLLTALPPHLQIKAALDDTKEILPVGIFMRCNTSVEPSYRALHRFLHPLVVRRRRLDDIVELHDNVGADRVLK